MAKTMGGFRCDQGRHTNYVVVAQYDCNHSTTVNNQRVAATGTADDRPRSGQPSVTTQQDQFIRTAHLRNSCQTAAKSALQT